MSRSDSDLRANHEMVQLGNQATMCDLRDLVRDSLGVKALYTSLDACTARCFVELPCAGGSAVYEWEICLLSSREDRVAHSLPSHSKENEVPSLEAALDRIVGRISDDNGQLSRCEEERIDPNGRDALDILYDNIRKYGPKTPHADILDGLAQHTATPRIQGIKTLRGIVSSADGRELAVFDYEQQALGDIFTFNRALLDDNEDVCLTDSKRRFIIYQLFKLVTFLHQRGLSSKNLIVPSRLALSLGMFIRLGGMPSPLIEEHPSRLDTIVAIPPSVEQKTPTEQWCRGDLSNYEYLMLLNATAGRRMIDGVFHPVMPWVTDFSAPFSGWRDLSKSKFRLNKGDNQLDRTYETSAVPHHITESLSEITYYIYLARRTPMAVLRQVIRSNFQPKEYPSSIERMFHWTPDECVPEFYSDPTVFGTIHGHDVMPDLTLPAWCASAEDFVKIHREMLESETVSAGLHHWIDLNFGVCLSGDAAIRNKNVPLHIQASAMRKNPGFVQLFQHPHPRRHTSKDVAEIVLGNTHVETPTRGSSDDVVRSASRIADAALSGNRPLSPSTRSASKQRHDQYSPPGTADRKGLSSSLVKLKKKQKPPSGSQIPSDGGFHSVSPSRDRDNTASRSPKFARLAHAIPKFFSTDQPSHSSPPASASVSTSEPLFSSSSGSKTSNSVDHDVSIPTGQASPSSHSSHLFRDLWHQLSKPEDSEQSEDHAHSLTSSQLADPLDWNERDFDTLDDTSLLLLRAGPRIDLKASTVAPPTHLFSTEWEANLTSIDPAYEIPATLAASVAGDETMAIDPREQRIADDLFTLGCVMTEIYLAAPLFSRGSIREYVDAYRLRASSSLWEQQLPLRERMRAVPLAIQNLILGLIHPDPLHRLSTWRRCNPERHLLKQKHSASASTALFPDQFPVLYAFLHDFHQHRAWTGRFSVAMEHLAALCALPDGLFSLCLPVLTSLFKPRSHVTSINRTHVCAAVVLLLPRLADRLGPHRAKLELLEDAIHLYDRPDLAPIIRMCLSTPEHLKAMIKAFGPSVVLRHVLPILTDWLASPPAYQATSPLFTSEATGMTAAALGEAASSDGLGASLSVKYLLPLLLSHLGKVSSKWAKLMDNRTVVSGLPHVAGGKNNGGIHVAFVSKHVLYETHGIADAVLLVCRELPPSAVSEILLPHLFSVLPRLVAIAESVSSAKIEGVPSDLAQEIYVTLRVLRHVVRSLSEQAVEKELLQRRSSQLISLLDSIQPPFLHPRTVDAVLVSASESALMAPAVRPSLARYQTAPPTEAALNNRRSRLIVDHLMALRSDKAQELRAFTAVGIARTVTGVLQKVGADAASKNPAAAAILLAINSFLTRCAATYSELEVTDFQWRMATEVVSEFCAPLRALLGTTAFARLLPIVSGSSVLQLLLLPVNNSDQAVATKARKQQTATGDVKELAESHPELVHAAYRSARIYGLKTTSFLHVAIKSNRLLSHDLNEDVFVAQEERKKRRAATTASSGSNGETAWLRPRVTVPFHSPSDGDPPPARDDTAIGASWLLRGHVHHSHRAHSSATRSIHVDAMEELVITASKSGSCRTWRLSSYPVSGTTTSAAIIFTPPIVIAQSLEDSKHAMAVTTNSVHVWDIRTSHVLFKAPFPDDRLHSSALLRVLPFVDWSGRDSPSALRGSADVAVSSNRKLFLLDTRTPRVVADWRADAHDATWITATALVCPPSSPLGLLGLGTASGVVWLLDKRMGSVVSQWQAVDSRVVLLRQYAAHHVLVVGSEREARVWFVGDGPPTLAMTVVNVPEGVRPQQISVQRYADTAVLYVAAATKVYCCRLPVDKAEAVATRRMESWGLMETAPGPAASPEKAPRLQRTKVAAPSIAVLPLRQVVLVGGEDGSLRAVV